MLASARLFCCISFGPMTFALYYKYFEVLDNMYSGVRSSMLAPCTTVELKSTSIEVENESIRVSGLIPGTHSSVIDHW